MGGAGPANFAGKLLNKLTAPQREGWGGLREERAEPAASSSSPTTPTTGQDSNLAGNLTTLGNSFIAFVGAGILDLPYAFSKVGLRLGSFVMLAVSLVCLHCMYMLIDCKIFLEKNGKKCSTYGEVGKEALGPAGGILVNIALSITQFGFCTAYFILISHNLDAILTDSPGYIPYIWLCVPGQMMLATLRHLKFLGKFSLIADVTMAFALGSVFYYCRNQLISQKDADMQRLQSDFSNAPYFFGVCIYCYEGIGMVIPIQAAMKNKHQFKLVWGINMALVTLLFWSVGFAGYSAYGVSVHESISSNLPAFEYLQVMVQLSLCIGLYFTFPVMMFPVYQIIESDEPVDASDQKGGYTNSVEFRQNLKRFGVVIMSAFVASAVPSFSSFVVLVGSSTCSLLALILPAVFSLKLRDNSHLAIAREGSIIIMGVIAAVLGTEDAIKRIAEG